MVFPFAVFAAAGTVKSLLGGAALCKEPGRRMSP